MVQVPTAYPPIQEKAIASYDYVDVADGLGMVIYYGLVSVDSAATSYVLISTKQYSHNIETATAVVGTTTMNFETSIFNLPKYVKGTAYISCGVRANIGASRMHMEFQLQKVHTNGVDTTNLSANILSPDVTASVHQALFVKIPITTESMIKKGEKLRMVTKFVNETANLSAFGHDPMNRDGIYLTPSTTGIPTIYEVHIPFRVGG